jgi:hypothetical protein
MHHRRTKFYRNSIEFTVLYSNLFTFVILDIARNQLLRCKLRKHDRKFRSHIEPKIIFGIKKPKKIQD